ncbi:V-type ATP synthase subunit E [Clostridium sp. CF011]|uniref:V-type ATP synthase subunit E n=1 Tax=unclassified Clostridium TaxID=2614128 RepID=UPI001C0DF86B|nr:MULTISPECIES: V-type ATP synthase subunit E [unclassified Clostridium]MBU3090698.1 V-type ATP synthase subunit E [Clostridium sp. CF011]MBW9144308.1 V-type ATP synthase subunit E [Clostridium sp. CM027]UVE41058.1 V-type ATP synthase subunit E [Clostridium sp. CM027]WAG70049.1 V-type ATP synthase subunit E [Clostridium sp. CF011]
MTTIEDKINLFSKIIYDKVNKEKEEKLETFSFEAEKKINIEKEKIEELRRSIQREVTKKTNIKANGIVAKERLNKQREVLFLKDKLISDALENVRVKLVQFVSCEEYKPYFISNLKKTLNAMDKGNYYIIVLKRDYEKFQSEIGLILKEYCDHNFEVKISEEDFIGGHILKDFEGTFIINNSIYAALQDSKETIGVRVMEMLA